jgi:general stress protein 26
MPTKKDIEARFWKALKSDMTMMLGLVNVENSHLRPLTAQLGGKKGAIWFFTARDTAIFRNLKKSSKGIATFVSKKHDIFATLHGRLSLDSDRATLDQLWNPFVAAWYDKGKEDPKLALLRLDPAKAEIWLDDSSFFAGIKMLLGADPKKDYAKNVAQITMK